jgi:hypothetical protein
MRIYDRVLIRPEQEAGIKGKRPPERRKLHDINCPWASSGNTGIYVERPRSEFAPDHPVCSWCGGPGGIEV